MRKLIAALAAAATLVASLAPVATTSAAEQVTIAALPFVSSAPLFIAQERGYYADEGLDVDLQMFRAAQPVAVAIASGDADFGVTAFTGGFFNLAGQGALKVIGAQSREEPGYDFSAYLVSNKAHEAGFDRPEEYPGHSLGITQRGSSFDLMLSMLADKLGFDLDGVRLVPLESVPNMIAAIKSGQVDSVILPAHIATALDQSGDARIIGWVHEHTPYQLGGLFTSTRNVEERPELVRKFVRAYQRAARDYADAMMELDADGNRVFGDKAEEMIPILQKYTEASPESIKAGAPYIDPMGRLDVRSVYGQVALLKEQGLVDEGVNPEDFIDLRFIEGHYNLPDEERAEQQ